MRRVCSAESCVERVSSVSRTCVSGADVLHRQITIPRCETVKIREMRHRRVEGSCRASAWHGSARPKVECTARTHCLLHSAKRDDKPFSHSAGADPSAWQRAQLPRPAWYKLGGHAHGRSLWVECVRPPPQVSLRPPSHAPMHAMVMLHMLVTVSRTVLLAGRQERSW